VDFQEIRGVVMDWFDLAQLRDKLEVLVNAVLNPRVA